MAEQLQNGYKIIAKHAPIVEGIAGHLYLQVVDPQGKLITQLDGLAIDPKTGKIPTIGQKDHDLKVVSSTTPRWETDATNPSQVLYSTTNPEEVKKIVETLKISAERINAQGLKYDLLAQQGYNSNSIFNTLVTDVQKVVPIKPEDIEKGRNLGGLNPGVGKIIEQAPASVGIGFSSSAKAEKEKTPIEHMLGFVLKPIQDFIRPIEENFNEMLAFLLSTVNMFLPSQKVEAAPAAPSPDPITTPPSLARPAPAPAMPMVADVPNVAAIQTKTIGIG